MLVDNGECMENLKIKENEVNKTKFDLLDKIWRNVRSTEQDHPLVATIMRMTHELLNATAALLFLINEENQEMLFKLAYGPAGKQFRELHISKQYGIAGWVTRNGKPLRVNDVNKDQCFAKSVDEFTGITTKSVICAPLVIHSKVIGAVEVLNRLDKADFNEQDLQILISMATIASLAIENIRLNEGMLDSYKSTVKELVSLVDARESNASRHSKRVSGYALMGATKLALSKEQKQIIEYAAVLHDIGKLSIPDRILNKSGNLTDEEWAIIHKHSVVGYNLLKGIPFLKEASSLILCHHERYDGKGYPQGLSGEAIPIGARLIAVADAFDTMTTKHAYRPAISVKSAFTELHKFARSQFCPVAVEAFCTGFVKSHLSGKL
jgi:putative nucleotidyltransferase with HDIG domain